MQTLLHIPENSVQEVIQQLCHIIQLSQPLLHKHVKAVFQKHFGHVDESVVKEVVETVAESDILSKSWLDNYLTVVKSSQFPDVNTCFFVLLFQVYQEFSRVVGKNLKKEFYGSLDRHCPQLIQVKERSRWADFERSSASSQGL